MRLRFWQRPQCGDVVTADDGEQFACQREPGHEQPHEWKRETPKLVSALTEKYSSYRVTWWHDQPPWYEATVSRTFPDLPPQNQT